MTKSTAVWPYFGALSGTSRKNAAPQGRGVDFEIHFSIQSREKQLAKKARGRWNRCVMVIVSILNNYISENQNITCVSFSVKDFLIQNRYFFRAHHEQSWMEKAEAFLTRRSTSEKHFRRHCRDDRRSSLTGGLSLPQKNLERPWTRSALVLESETWLGESTVGVLYS